MTDWKRAVSPYLVEEWEERAAIMEHCGGADRESAEKRAALRVLAKAGLELDLLGAVRRIEPTAVGARTRA